MTQLVQETTVGDRDRPLLHIHPRSGWLNDPNGLCRIDGTYHVFFQHNPAAPVHDDIHWGHVSSADLLHWTPEPIALVPQPDGADRGGCWSGCVVDDGGVPTAVYTAIRADVHDAGVNLSRSDRTLRRWTPDRAWRIAAPADPGISHVRDPFVFHHDGRRYAVQGAGKTGGRPQVLLYQCDDLRDWSYLGPLLTDDDPVAGAVAQATVWECPNLFRLDGRWVLLISLWRDDVLSGVRYLLGDLVRRDLGWRFVAESGGKLDAGPAFYAPQVLVEPDRVLLWGWAWEGSERTPAEIDAAGWNGTLTSPREVVLRGDAVVLEPAAELSGLRRETWSLAADGSLDVPAFEVLAPTGLRLRLADPRSGEIRTVVEADTAARLIVDGSLVELFAAGPSITTRAYPGEHRRWLVDAPGGEVWRLGLPD
ncbi:MAG TPA: glycoside hydrolase family 32 protein [Microlunatus sp.]|nr:glycoside hydrolase family 32 protein [Microlunatus sp.]